MKHCLFCDTRIGYKAVVCRAHREWYTAHKDSAWVKELKQLESKQLWITVKESQYPLMDVPEGGERQTLLRGKGGAHYTKEQIELIREYYQSGKTPKAIATEMGIHPKAVSAIIFDKRRKDAVRVGAQQQKARKS